MNIEKLVAAAKWIDIVGEKRDEHLRACQQLVIDMQTNDLSGAEIAERQKILTKTKHTISFGAGIAELRKALREPDKDQTPECGFSFDKNQMRTKFL